MPLKNTGMLLNPSELLRIKNFKLRVRGAVEGFLVGAHKSPYHGFSAEFSEHRAYAPGDDLRWLDWKALARTGRPFTKVFEEETNLRAYLMVDTSGSMAYGNKMEYSATLAGAMAYLLYLQRDAVGLVPFSDGVLEVIPPRTGRVHLESVLTKLSGLSPKGKTSPRVAFLELAGLAKKRGLVILISDLMASPDEITRGVRAFRFKKHHVIVFHILSPEETRAPERPGLYEDMETGQRVRFHPSSGAELYRRSLLNWKKAIEVGLLDAGAEYHAITTDTPLSRALSAFFTKRARMP
ncbi:MAG: DUF58 domain-containing protein [candidate division WOR-3 bacterium]